VVGSQDVLSVLDVPPKIRIYGKVSRDEEDRADEERGKHRRKGNNLYK